MTFKQFDDYQENLLKQVVKMKDTKGKEYANSESRFANFDRSATKKGVDRLVVAGILLDKHLDAIDSYIKNKRIYSTEGIQGRIVDAITYLTLIGGMIEEEEEGDEDYKYHGAKPQIVTSNLDDNKCILCDRPFKPGQKIALSKTFGRFMHVGSCLDPEEVRIK